MRRDERLAENFGAAEVKLTEVEFQALEEELKKIVIHGNRTDKDIEKLLIYARERRVLSKVQNRIGVWM